MGDRDDLRTSGLADEVKQLRARIQELEQQVVQGQAEIDRLQQLHLQDEDQSLMHRDVFIDRLRSEIRAAERYGRFLAVVLISVYPSRQYQVIHHQEPERMRDILSDFGVRLNTALRETDSVSVIDDNLLAVMLVEAEERNALMVVSRLKEETDDNIEVRWALASYPSDAPRDDELLTIARDRLSSAQRSGSGTVVSGSVILAADEN